MEGFCHLFLILVLGLHHGLVDLVPINCGNTNQSPIQTYELTQVPENQTYSTDLRIPILIDLAYDNLSRIVEAATYMQGLGEVCFFKSALESARAVPEGSNVSQITLTLPYLRDLAVILPFDHGRHSLRLQFNTTWKNVNGDVDTFISSLLARNLINMSYFAYLLPYQRLEQDYNSPPPEVKACDYEVDIDWCKTPTSSNAQLGRVPRLLPSGQCVIDFVSQMEKYKEMWIPAGYPSHEFNKRCFPYHEDVQGNISQPTHHLYKRYGYRYYPGPPAGPWKSYQQNFLHEGGIGEVANLTFGRDGLIDVNLTIDVEHWSVEFYQYFIDMVRDKDVRYGFQNSVKFMQYGLTNMTIYYFTPPPPPVIIKTIPFYTWIFLALAAVPAFTMVVACILIISTRSLKGFDPRIWRLWLATQKEQARRSKLQQEVMTK